MRAKFNADRILGISAIMISLMTLFIFLYQTNLIKEQSRLSVRPRLAFSKNIDRTVTQNDSLSTTVVNLQMVLKNNGLGPALIEATAVMDKGTEYDMSSFFETVYPGLKDYGVFLRTTDLTAGSAILASESTVIFSYEYDLINQDKINNYLGVDQDYELPFDVVVEYSSMYEEKWRIVSNQDGHPEEVN